MCLFEISFIARTSTADPFEDEKEESVETSTTLVTIAPTEEDMTTLPSDSGDLLETRSEGFLNTYALIYKALHDTTFMFVC